MKHLGHFYLKIMRLNTLNLLRNNLKKKKSKSLIQNFNKIIMKKLNMEMIIKWMIQMANLYKL